MSAEIQRLAGLLIAAAGIGFAASLACRALAFRLGAVSHPRRDRWGTTTMPLLGGPAMVFATALTLWFVPGLPSTVWILLAGAAGLAVVGLVDDVRPIAPSTKVAAQLAAAIAVTALGLRFPLTGIATLDVIITVGWLAGLANAFNLLDNMDGLAAGIAVIAGGVKLVLFAMEGNWPGAGAAAVFSGACAGFLVLNFNPARIFMGDAGSLFLGFFVAGLSTIGGVPNSRATMSVLIGPVAILLVPIFDTILVTVLRLLAGRPVSQGGRDHASHRLLTAGFSVRRTVLTLYALAVVSGVVAIVTREASRPLSFALFAALAALMVGFGIVLARIKVEAVDAPAPVAELREPPRAV